MHRMWLLSGAYHGPSRGLRWFLRHDSAATVPRYRSTTAIAQYLPHMLHASLLVGVLRWPRRAISGTSASSACALQSRALRARDIFLSHSKAPGTPFTMSAAWAAIR